MKLIFDALNRQSGISANRASPDEQAGLISCNRPLKYECSMLHDRKEGIHTQYKLRDCTYMKILEIFNLYEGSKVKQLYMEIGFQQFCI